MSSERVYFVYILTNRKRTLSIGVTHDLEKRVFQHKQGKVPGFTRKYNVGQLVYYEATGTVRSAIAREKELKGWTRARKVRLIELTNPRWKDLYAQKLAM